MFLSVYKYMWLWDINWKLCELMSQAVVTQAYYPNTGEAEAGGLWFQGLSDLQSEIQGS